MKNRLKKNPYLKVSLYAFCTLAAAILFYQLSRDFSFVKTFFDYLFILLGPIVTGAIIAYLVNPLLNFYELTVFQKAFQKKRARRTISLVCAYLSALVIIGVLGLLIVPQLVRSVENMIANFSIYKDNAQSIVNELSAFSEKLFGESGNLSARLPGILEDAKNSILGTFSSLVTAIPDVLSFLTDLTTRVTNVFVGLVISVYLLADKERFAAQTKKMLCAFFKQQTVAHIVDFFHDMHDSVGGFIIAKVLDGAVVGVLAFLVFSIFSVPFALLISVILALCNIIPFFGQIIGPVIGGLILLVTAPEQLLWYIVMCVAIMVVDANLISPKLIGARIGISPFWIVLSLLVGGRLFGFWGMFLGSPVFAVLYGMFKRFLENRLKKRDFSASTADYYDFLHEEPLGIFHIAFKKEKDFSAPVPMQDVPEARKDDLSEPALGADAAGDSDRKARGKTKKHKKADTKPNEQEGVKPDDADKRDDGTETEKTLG